VPFTIMRHALFDKPRARPATDVVRPGNLPDRSKNTPTARVLIVDDEPLIRWSLAETLADRGCYVAEAGDARAALNAMKGDGFDVVLLDFQLPDSNDLLLLARLRAMAPDARVILMTAHNSADMRQQALALGAFSVIGKPFEVSELATLVRDAYASRRP
jgi:DNA-binding NtrC family response regulator